MKLLFIGDPHIKTDNADDIDILMNEIKRITSQTVYDAIIVGGDVMHYHERLFTPALNKSLQFIDMLRTIAYTYVLVGNHDAINNSIFLTDQHWMNALKSWNNVKIVDKVVNGTDFILCPYVPPGRFVEALETGEADAETQAGTQAWQSVRVIFAHQEFKGCKMGAITSMEGDEWKEDWPYVISGHIHDNQRVGDNIYYPGTPLQHSFGDSSTRVLCHIEWDGEEGETIVEDISLHVPSKQIVHATLQTLTEKMANVTVDEHEKLKIKLDASTVEFSAFKQTKEYKQLIEKGVKIQLQKKIVKEVNTTDDKNDFLETLERLVEDDETLVRSLYHEVLFDKLVI